MYYLYLIESIMGRAGFGIAACPKDRNKQYASHSGDIVKFRFVYGGLRTHAKAIEKTIKTQFVDNIWKIEDWKTEWLNNDVSMLSLKSYVDELIQQRHYNLKLVATDYDFSQSVLDS